RSTYCKFLPRTVDDFATVSICAVVRLDDDGRIDHARVALGSVGVTPIRATMTEAALIGQVPTPANLREISAIVRDEISPLDDARGGRAYKLDMARVWTERALAEVAR